ncbi:1-acyl-sn-glycerol-3-phosphate acyltransferase [Thermotoga sp. KOL6]|uniref:lysophospholipid acyltransferase family protein n=1 Tax=Thermotoga sp. KOL6 TaxID=126741 RepID=UPI000C75639F|nr:lysophospholipid acyltransferase family protein [Thermotoga sp. KOL6]PLV60079.1 acyl-phosphate glycerol 3-phosphate acyltransferase [Thermotoga sp. KOL6]
MKRVRDLLVTLYFYFIATVYIVFYGGFVLFRSLLIRDKKRARDYVLKEIEKFGRRAFKWLFSEVIVRGSENIPKNRNFIVVANHQSLMDIPLILGFVTTGAFIAKEELKKVPGVNWYIRYLNGVFLDRKNPRKAVKALREVIQKLKNGVTFIVFPEGTRSPDGRVLPFKKDSLMIAMKAKVPILPVSIWGTYNLIPKKRLTFTPGKVYLKIHAPVDPEEFSNEEELRKYVEEIIKQGVDELRGQST